MSLLLLYPETKKTDVLSLNLTLCCHVSFPSIMGFVILTIEYTTKEFKPHTRTHHAVIIVLLSLM